MKPEDIMENEEALSHFYTEITEGVFPLRDTEILINPVFFYMNDGIRYNPNSDAELYYYKTYWYGND